MTIATRPMTAPRRDRTPADAAYATPYHAPVMVRETVELLVKRASGTYVDGTLGGGGHAAAILDALDTKGRLFGVDQDPEAIAEARRRIGGDGRFSALKGNFGSIDVLLAAEGVAEVDGILLDLGVSSHQIDAPQRGFAYAQEGPLDMRMDPTSGFPADELVNDAPEAELAHILRTYGDEPRAHKIARKIVAARPLANTAELADAVRGAVPFKEEVKSLSRVFQGLRIAVNRELEVLETALVASLRLLRPGGRLAVIAYHSLEDRRVKHFMRYGNFENEPVRDFYGNLLTPWETITRKPVQPGDSEVEANPRSRSARLRVAEKRAPEESGLGTAYDYPQTSGGL